MTLGQVQNIPLNYVLHQELNIHETNLHQIGHQAIKPYNQQFISSKSFDYTFKDTTKYYYDAELFLFKRSLLEINEKDVFIGADILLEGGIGRSSTIGRTDSRRMYSNTRGFRVVGNIGSNVSFETRFYESQFFFPKYLDSIAWKRGVAFGLGRTKAFKTYGFDVGNSLGYVSVKVSKQINLQFGHDKIFIGHGYRSLLISDNTSSYPLLKFRWQSLNGKWNYLNVNAWMQSLSRQPVSVSTEALFKRKGASFRYLSFQPNPHWNFGLFEGVIYKNYDETKGSIPLNYSFYIPIIGASTAINGFENSSKSVLGINIGYHLKKTFWYGQMALDQGDKIGYQVGAKWLEPFSLKKNWMNVEYNSVSSYMYSNSTEDLLQSYTHMNQELAHPIGASFQEITFLYHAQLHRFFGDFQWTMSLRERGENNEGENIFKANDLVYVAPIAYEKVTTHFLKLEIGVNLNIKTRLQLYGGVYRRTLNNLDTPTENQNENFYMIGIRTLLNNYYHDL